MAVYPYTSEIYETLLRGKAMGVMSAFGRIGTMALGIAGVSALYWFDGNGLYILFLILSSLSALMIYKMPFDTLGRPLDHWFMYIVNSKNRRTWNLLLKK